MLFIIHLYGYSFLNLLRIYQEQNDSEAIAKVEYSQQKNDKLAHDS